MFLVMNVLICKSKLYYIFGLYFQELFIKLEAHQCLGSIWNQRSREKANECPSVAATIAMFNSVIYTVISTILKVKFHISRPHNCK